MINKLKGALIVLIVLVVGAGIYFVFSAKKETLPLENLSPQKLHEETYELMQKEEYYQALERAEAAIKIDPNYLDAWVDKGMALYEMGKCTDGAAALYHAVNLDPENEMIGDMLGSMLNKCKEIENQLGN